MLIRDIYPELIFGWECFRSITRGRNSSHGSVLGLLSCLMQRRGFDPPVRRTFSSRRDFSHGVKLRSDTKTLSDESVNQGIVCAHMHSIGRPKRS